MTRHCINNYEQKGSAAREQGNLFVASSCIARMKDLRAPAFDIYQSEIKLALARATIEMDGVQKAEALVEAISIFDKSVWPLVFETTIFDFQSDEESNSTSVFLFFLSTDQAL